MKMAALVLLGGHCHPGRAYCTTAWVSAQRVKGGSREDFEKKFLYTSRRVRLGGGIKVTASYQSLNTCNFSFLKKIGKILSLSLPTLSFASLTQKKKKKPNPQGNVFAWRS